MHVAAPDRPARQRHREPDSVQPKIATVAVRFDAPTRCWLSWCAARHGARHLPSPLSETRERKRERDPTREQAAGPTGLDHFPRAPRLGAIALRWFRAQG